MNAANAICRSAHAPRPPQATWAWMPAMVLLWCAACAPEPPPAQEGAGDWFNILGPTVADFHQGNGCMDCHAIHGTSGNRGYIPATLATPNSGSKSVVFLATTGPNSFADGDSTYDGICEVCHTTTAHHRNNASGDHSHYAGQNCLGCHAHEKAFSASIDHVAAGKVVALAECMTCHGTGGSDPVADVHSNSCGKCHINPNGGGAMIEPFETNAPSGGNCSACHGTFAQAHQNVNHTATPGTGAVIIFADNDHDDAGWNGPKPYFDVAVTCTTCHRTNLPVLHGNRCATCHPAPVSTLGSWNGSCSQGGCHGTIHDKVLESHWPFSDPYDPGNNCNNCHNPGINAVVEANCLNCHKTPAGGDTTPPVTSTDAKTSYTGPGRIDFIIKDSNKVGIGTTFYQLDGGSEQVGSSVLVSAPGSHTLKYRSMDQAGNMESPQKQVTFTIVADTTPPTTTSNAVSSYYNGATILFTATDASTQGVKATRYTLNGGAVQTGASVYVPGIVGVKSYTLVFWSEDWSGNIETAHTVNFTVTSGSVTLRLVWGDSDVGSPPANPDDWADWYIRRGSCGGPLIKSGGNANPGWSGVDDVVVPVSPLPYCVSIDWWDSYYGWDDNTTFSSVSATTPGAVIRLSY